MFVSKVHYVTGLAVFALNLIVTAAISGELQASAEVLSNVEILSEKKSCPQCNLSGAELNRFDLSGANLEGANLTRAKMYLVNLSGANLRHSNLQEAQFGGADLGGADLRGANLTGTSFAGAYMQGTLLEGEMVETTPYADDDISDVEQKVYIDDTAKPKRNPQTDDLTIVVEEDKQKVAPRTSVTEEINDEPEFVANEDKVPESTVHDEAYEEVVRTQSMVSDPGEIESKDSFDDTIEPKRNPQSNTVTILDEENKQKVIPATSGTEEGDQITELDSEEKNLPPVLQNETYKEVVKNKSVAPDSKILPAINTVRITNENATATESTRITIGDVKEQDVTSDLESVKEENVAVEVQSEQSEVDKIVSETIAEEPVAENVEIANEVIAAITAPVLSDEVLHNLERLLDDNKCYGCNLVGVNLTGENLDSADLESADLTDAVLIGADLEDANLKQVNLTNADLTEADLTAADLYKANLTNANLSGATLEDTKFDDAIMTDAKGYQQNRMMMVHEQE